jgi:hypothetical protein
VKSQGMAIQRQNEIKLIGFGTLTEECNKKT